jgi:hypothetical protein
MQLSPVAVGRWNSQTLRFCERVWSALEANPDALIVTWLSDEAHFNLHSYVSKNIVRFCVSGNTGSTIAISVYQDKRFLFLFCGVALEWVHSVRRPLVGPDDRRVWNIWCSKVWSTRRKSAPVPLCPPHFPLTWDRTPAAAVTSSRLTAWAVVQTSTQSYSRGCSTERPIWGPMFVVGW